MYVFFIISAAVLLLLWTIVRGRSAHVQTPDAAQVAIIPVDLDAFRNLIDSSQDRYLRSNLARPEFRRVQRARYLAVAEYLHRVARNASIILRVGESARVSHQSEVEKEGAAMASAAVMLRLLCLVALAQAYLGYVFPGMGVSVGSVADGYDRLTAKLWAMRHTWTPVRTAS